MEKKRRLFVAINLPEKIRKEIASFQDRYPEIPARWTSKENLHLTIFFAGMVFEENIEKIKEAIEKAVEKSASFDFAGEKIAYAPPGTKVPNMIWLVLEKSKTLSNLKEEIESQILKTKVENFRIEGREFSPHITLARIRRWEFQKMEPEEIPTVDQKFFFKFRVKSVELMESTLKREGAEYAVLESFPLR